MQKYQEAGIAPPILIEARNLAFIIEQVEAGEGVSFTSIWAFKDRIERGTLKIRTLDEGPFWINISLAYLKSRVLSPPAQAFMDLLMASKTIDHPPQTAKTFVRARNRGIPLSKQGRKG